MGSHSLGYWRLSRVCQYHIRVHSRRSRRASDVHAPVSGEPDRWVLTADFYSLSPLIPFSAVAQTTEAFTSAMLSTLAWNPKEYVKRPTTTLPDLFVASPLQHST